MYFRKQIRTILFSFLFLLLNVVPLYAADKEVVVYTALDQIFSEPILKDFEKQYNIKVKAAYDVEAVKTTGLVNRLIAEKKHPRCDVFWNNEVIRTMVLKRMGVLAPYHSPEAAGIPVSFKDKEGYWAGFAARARVLVVNTDLVAPQDYPGSIIDFLAPRWQGKTAMANPLFGTTATHVSALYTTMGKEQALQFFKDQIANKTRIVDGNSVVRDMVGSGEVLWGLTDTDDVNVGILSGMPIKAILPDQQAGGTLLIPNTISLVAGGPNPDAGKMLIDFILSKKTEARLCSSESAQIPVRKDVPVPEGRLRGTDIVAMQVDYQEMADVIDESTRAAQNIFIR